MPGALILTERNKQMIKHGLCMNDREKQPEPEPEKIQGDDDEKAQPQEDGIGGIQACHA